MYLKTQGLVLREVAYKDTDKLLTVLTRDYGKMTLKARGVRRSGSPLKASCQLLACGEFTIFEYRGMSTINEAQTVELFPELRTDLELLSLGTYFAQVAEVLSQEDDPNPALLSLTLNALYALGKLRKPQGLVKAVFELRRPVWRDIPRTWRGAGVAGIRSRTVLIWKAAVWSARIAGAEMGLLWPSHLAFWRRCATSLPARPPGCFPSAWGRRRFGPLAA